MRVAVHCTRPAMPIGTAPSSDRRTLWLRTMKSAPKAAVDAIGRSIRSIIASATVAVQNNIPNHRAVDDRPGGALTTIGKNLHAAGVMRRTHMAARSFPGKASMEWDAMLGTTRDEAGQGRMIARGAPAVGLAAGRPMSSPMIMGVTAGVSPKERNITDSATDLIHTVTPAIRAAPPAIAEASAKAGSSLVGVKGAHLAFSGIATIDMEAAIAARARAAIPGPTIALRKMLMTV